MLHHEPIVFEVFDIWILGTILLMLLRALKHDVTRETISTTIRQGDIFTAIHGNSVIG